MKELKWKYLVRSIVRGKILMTGALVVVKQSLCCQLLINWTFILTWYTTPGSSSSVLTSIRRRVLILRFICRIFKHQTTILLDELSRTKILEYSNDRSWPSQRYLRLDESSGQAVPVVVVCFRKMLLVMSILLLELWTGWIVGIVEMMCWILKNMDYFSTCFLT